MAAFCAASIRCGCPSNLACGSGAQRRGFAGRGPSLPRRSTCRAVGQNAGENIGLGAPVARDLTRDTLGDFAGGFMMGGPIGALGGHASHRTPATVATPATDGSEKRPIGATVAVAPGKLDAGVLPAALAPDAGPLTRAAGVGVISGAVRAEWARQKGEREAERVDMIDRLTELDTKAAGTLEKKGASGKVTHKD